MTLAFFRMFFTDNCWGSLWVVQGPGCWERRPYRNIVLSHIRKDTVRLTQHWDVDPCWGWACSLLHWLQRVFVHALELPLENSLSYLLVWSCLFYTLAYSCFILLYFSNYFNFRLLWTFGVLSIDFCILLLYPCLYVLRTFSFLGFMF